MDASQDRRATKERSKETSCVTKQTYRIKRDIKRDLSCIKRDIKRDLKKRPWTPAKTEERLKLKRAEPSAWFNGRSSHS